jgi:hypothetical protein
MILEPPSGLRQNILRTYEAIEAQKDFYDCTKPDIYKNCYFGLSFHAIVRIEESLDSLVGTFLPMRT